MFIKDVRCRENAKPNIQGDEIQTGEVRLRLPFKMCVGQETKLGGAFDSSWSPMSLCCLQNWPSGIEWLTAETEGTFQSQLFNLSVFNKNQPNCQDWIMCTPCSGLEHQNENKNKSALADSSKRNLLSVFQLNVK